MPEPQMSQRYQVVETTDLLTGTKSYRIYDRSPAITPPLASGFATREAAEARLQELEAGNVIVAKLLEQKR
jgi:hypothetical protein